MLMPYTVAPSWRDRLSKPRIPRCWLMWLLLTSALLGLTGCSSSIATVPRLPEPAADLLRPAPTGSEYLGSVSDELKASRDDLTRWEKMLRDGLIK